MKKCSVATKSLAVKNSKKGNVAKNVREIRNWLNCVGVFYCLREFGFVKS